MNTAVKRAPNQSKNSHPSRSFTVGAVGVSSKDYQSLTRIFSVTNFRPRSYKLVELDLKDDKRKECDIYLVNVASPENVVNWHRYAKNNENISIQKVVMIGKNQSTEETGYSIGTPINPIKVLKTLDTFTIRELKYLPEFEIGGDDAPQENTLEEINLLRSEPISNSAKIRSLIVDDSLAVRRQLEIEFDLLGADSHIATCGEEAIEEAATYKFDIICLDVVMPGIDGYATCKKIKKSELNRNTPIILLTSRSSSFDKFKGTLAGCDTYLTKPIDHNEFESVAKKHIST